MSFPNQQGPSGPQFQRPYYHPEGARLSPPVAPERVPAPRRKNFLGSRTFVGVVAAVLGFAIGSAGGAASTPESAPGATATLTQESTAFATVTATATATATAVTTAVSTQTVTVTASPPQEPAFTVVPGEYRDLEERDFKLIAKDPDSYAGDQITIYGEVTQFDSATGTTVMRADTGGTKKEVEYGYTDYDQNAMISGTETILAEIVEGDVFEAQVHVLGAYSYETQIGGSTTVPHFEVVAITVYDSID